MYHHVYEIHQSPNAAEEAIKNILDGSFDGELIWGVMTYSDFRAPGFFPERMNDGHLVSFITHKDSKVATIQCGPEGRLHGQGFTGKALVTREVLENMFRTGAVVADGEGHDRLLQKQRQRNDEARAQSILYHQGLANLRAQMLADAEPGRKPILSLILERIESKCIHVGAPTLEVIAEMDAEKLSRLLHDMLENPFVADLSIGREASLAMIDQAVTESTASRGM